MDIAVFSYITNHFNLFENNSIPKESENRKVKVKNRFLPIKKRGTIRTHFNTFKIKFINTFYIPRLEISLLSTIKLYRKGYTGIFDYKKFTIFPVSQPDKPIIKTKKLDNESLFITIQVLNESTEEAFAGLE